jgi:hypothetical protein
MALTPTNYGASPFQPGIQQDAFIPDQLIAGDLKVVTKTATITGAAALIRGTVLGKVMIGAASSAVKSGGNTGNGTFGLDATTPILSFAEVGVYTLRCIVAAANSGTFRLTSPAGRVLGDYTIAGGAGGTVTVANQIKGVITDAATDFVVGDGFDITVAAGSGAYKKAIAAALDGSATPVAILTDDADATSADVLGGIYTMGEFNGNALTLGAGITLAAATAALEANNIYIKTPLSAADPT